MRIYKNCVPFEGTEAKWRDKVAQIVWIELGVDPEELSWPMPECGTQGCLNHKHLIWAGPKHLAYPQGICAYCGIIADTEDHLLPRTWTGDAVRRNVLVVPSCRQCNSYLSDKFLPSITARRREAHDIIRERHRKVLVMPDWEPEELAELGHTLRSSVMAGLHAKSLTLARLAWPEEHDFDLRVMHLSGIENPYEVGLLELLKGG